MLLVITAAPVWTGIVEAAAECISSFGLLGASPVHSTQSSLQSLLQPDTWTFIAEPASEDINHSVDSAEDAARAARRRSLLLYRQIATALVNNAPKDANVFVLLREGTVYRSSAARQGMLAHIRDFARRLQAQRGDGQGSSEGAVPFDTVYLAPEWLQEGWKATRASRLFGAAAIHGVGEPSLHPRVRSQRPSWLSGWLFGRFAVEERYVAPSYGSHALATLMHDAAVEMTASRTDKLPSEEESPPAVAEPFQLGEGWTGAFALAIDPYSTLRQLSGGGAASQTRLPAGAGYLLIDCCFSEDGTEKGNDILSVLPSALVSGRFPVLIVPVPSDTEGDVHSIDIVQTFHRATFPFAVVSLTREGGVELLESCFGTLALLSAVVHLLECSREEGSCRVLTPHPDVAGPSSSSDGAIPFLWMATVRSSCPLSILDSTSAPVAVVGVPGSNGGRDDKRSSHVNIRASSLPLYCGVLESDSLEEDAQGSVRQCRCDVPRSWAGQWTRGAAAVSELEAVVSPLDSLTLLGHCVCLYRHIPDDYNNRSDVGSEGDAAAATAVALLLSAALRAVPKRILDEGKLWLVARHGRQSSLRWARIPGRRPRPENWEQASHDEEGGVVPLLLVSVPCESEHHPDGEAWIVLHRGNVVKYRCDSCPGDSSPCLHVGALCAAACATVLSFSVGPRCGTAPIHEVDSVVDEKEGSVVEIVHAPPPSSRPVVLDASGLPLFMTGTPAPPRKQRKMDGPARTARTAVAATSSDTGAPPPPPRRETVFFCYSRLTRPAVARDNPTASASDISRLLGAAWRNLTEEEKATYREKCQEYPTSRTAVGPTSPQGRRRKAAGSKAAAPPPAEPPITEVNDEAAPPLNAGWYRSPNGEWRCEWDDDSSDGSDGDAGISHTGPVPRLATLRHVHSGGRSVSRGLGGATDFATHVTTDVMSATTLPRARRAGERRGSSTSPQKE